MMKIFYNQEFLSSISKIGSKVTIKDYRLSSYEESVGGLTRLFEESYIETLKLSPSSGVYSFDSIWDSDDKKLYINLEVPELDTDILDPTKYKIIYVYYSDYYDTVSSKIAFVLIGDYKTDGNGRIVIEPLRLSLGKNLIIVDLSEEIKGNIETKLDEDTKFLESKGPDTGVNIYYALEKLQKMDEGEEKTLYSQSLVSIGSWESYIKDLQADDSSADSSEISPYFDKNGIKVFNSFIYYEYTNLKIYFNEISESETSKLRHLEGDQEGEFSLLASIKVRVHMKKNGRDTILEEYTDTNIQKTRISYQFKSMDSEGSELESWTTYDENTNTLLYSQNPDALLGRKQIITAKYIADSGTVIESDEISLIQEEGPLVFEIIEDNEYYYYNEDISSSGVGEKRLKLLESYSDDYVNFDIRCNGRIEYEVPDKLIRENTFNERFELKEIKLEDKYIKRYKLKTKFKHPSDAPQLYFEAGVADANSPICMGKEIWEDPVSGNIKKERWIPFKIGFTAFGNGKINEGLEIHDRVFSLQKRAFIRTSISPFLPNGTENLEAGHAFPWVSFFKPILTQNPAMLDQWENTMEWPTIPFVEESEKYKYFSGGIIYPNISEDTVAQKVVNELTRRSNCILERCHACITITPYDDTLEIGNIDNLFGKSYENEDYQMKIRWKKNERDLESENNVDLTHVANHPELFPDKFIRWTKTTDLAPGAQIESAVINRFENHTVIYFRSYFQGNDHPFLKGQEFDYNIPGYVTLIPKKNNLEKKIARRRWCVSWYPTSKFPTTEDAINNWKTDWMNELYVLRVKVNTYQADGEPYILNQETEEIVLKDFNAVPFYIKSNFRAKFLATNVLDHEEIPVEDSARVGEIAEWWNLCKQITFQAFDPDIGFLGDNIRHTLSKSDYNTGSLIYVRLKGLPERPDNWVKNKRAQIGTLLLSGTEKFLPKRIKVFLEMSDIDIAEHYPKSVFNDTTENTGHIFLLNVAGAIREVPVYTTRPLYLVDYSGVEGSLGKPIPDDKGRGAGALVGDEDYATFVLIPKELDKPQNVEYRLSRFLNLRHVYYDGDEAHGTKYKYSYFHIVPKTNNFYKDIPELMLMTAHTVGGFEEAETTLNFYVHQLTKVPTITFDDPDMKGKIILGHKEGNEATFSISYPYPEYLQTGQTNTDLFETEVEIINDTSNSIKLTTKTINESNNQKFIGTLSLIPDAGFTKFETPIPGSSNGYIQYTVKVTDIFCDVLSIPFPNVDISVYQQSPDFSIDLVEVDLEGNPYDSGSIIPPNGQERHYKVDTTFSQWEAETIGSVGQVEVIMDDENKDVIWTVPNRNAENRIYTWGEFLSTQREKLKLLLKDIIPVGVKVYQKGDSGYYDKVSIKQAGYSKYIIASVYGKTKYELSSIYYMVSSIVIGEVPKRTIWVNDGGEDLQIEALNSDLEKGLIDSILESPDKCTFSIQQIGDYKFPEENINIDEFKMNLSIPPFLKDGEKITRSFGVIVSTPKLPNGEILKLPLEIAQQSIYFNIEGNKELYYFADGELARNLGNGNWGFYGENEPLVNTKIKTNISLNNWDYAANTNPAHPEIIVKFYNSREGSEMFVYDSPIRKCEIRSSGSEEYSIIVSMLPNQGNYNPDLAPLEGYLRFYTPSNVLLDEIHILQGCANCYVYDEYVQQRSGWWEGNAPSNPSRDYFHPIVDGVKVYGTSASPPFTGAPYATYIITRMRLEVYENPEAKTWRDIPRIFSRVGSFNYGQEGLSYTYPHHDINVYNTEDGVQVELRMTGNKISHGTSYFYFNFKILNPYTGVSYIYSVPFGNRATEYTLGWWVYKPKR